MGIRCENALRWMPQNFTNDKSMLVQLMSWCRQATCRYLSQCLPRSVSPYDISRPLVNRRNAHNFTGYWIFFLPWIVYVYSKINIPPWLYTRGSRFGAATRDPFLNSSPPGQNGCQIADDIFKYIFINEKFCISIQFSMKFDPKDPIDNKQTRVQVMTCRRTGDKPLPEPILTQCTVAYMRH